MNKTRGMASLMALSMVALASASVGGIYGGGHETPEYHSPMADDNRTDEQKWKDKNAKLAKAQSKNERKLARLQKAYPHMRSIEDFK